MHSLYSDDRFIMGRHISEQANFGQGVWIRRSTLALGILALGLFPRLLAAMGVPSVINFIHFGAVLFFFLVTLDLSRPFTRRITAGLLGLLAVIFFSAILNAFSMANVALDFLLLAEPFLLLSIIVTGDWTVERINRYRRWLLVFVLAHIAVVYYQYFVLGLRDDDVKGVFLNQGAGHHVGGGVALAAAIYFLATPWCRSWPARVGLGLLMFMDIIFSDSKQVLAAFIVSLLAMVVLKAGNIKRLASYALIAIASVAFVYVLASTVVPSYAVWMNPYLIRDGLETKSSVLPHIIAFYDMPTDWLFGLGPGGSVGRLAWLIPDYTEQLQNVGITTSPVTKAIFTIQEGNWISNSVTGSSIWSLTFSWAGIWGDLGLVGLGMYVYLWSLVWRFVAKTDISKYLLLTVFILGFIFAWMEEPGFMLIVVSIVGLQWQEYRLGEESRAFNQTAWASKTVTPLAA